MVIFYSYVSLPEGTTLTGWWFMWFVLVGGLKHVLNFPFHIWDVILPIDELIFFRGVGIPPTNWDPLG